LEGSNCGGASIFLANDNEINRDLTLGFGLPFKQYSMEANLIEFSKKNLKNAKMDDTRLYFSKDGSRWHAATFLLENHKETQVFYKRNGTATGTYIINFEKNMRDNYDVIIDGNYRK